MEKFPGAYKPYEYANVLSSEKIGELSEDVGMYAGGLSLALLGVGPEAINKPVHFINTAKGTNETVNGASLDLVRQSESLQQMGRLGLTGSVETFNKYDLAA